MLFLNSLAVEAYTERNLMPKINSPFLKHWESAVLSMSEPKISNQPLQMQLNRVVKYLENGLLTLLINRISACDAQVSKI